MKTSYIYFRKNDGLICTMAVCLALTLLPIT